MKIFTRACFVIVVVLSLSGCLYGQCMNGECSLERARSIKNSTSYGQQWIKEGMTKESRQADWEACGGWKNGSYGTSLPSRTMEESKMADADSSRKYKELYACMTSKGYYHVYEFECDARCLHR
jgi:hypothetical protein